jgi:hypothetical protein
MLGRVLGGPVLTHSPAIHPPLPCPPPSGNRLGDLGEAPDGLAQLTALYMNRMVALGWQTVWPMRSAQALLYGWC